MINTYGKPPMAHRIQIDRPYVPSFATDIRKTFEAERNRLTREAFGRGEMPHELRDYRPSGRHVFVVSRELFDPSVLRFVTPNL